MVNLYRNFSIKSFLKNNEIKKGAAYTFFSFLSSGINFILLLFITKYIPPTGYGTLNMIAVLIALFSVVSTFGCSGYQNVVYFRSDFNAYRRVVVGLLILGTIFLLIVNFIILLGHNFIFHVTELEYKYQLIAVFISYSNMFLYIFQEYLRVKEKIRLYGIVSILGVILNTLLTIHFVIFCNSGWIGRLYAQVLTAIVFFVVSIVVLCKIIDNPIKNIPSKKEMGEMLRWGIPLIPHQMSFWIRQSIDRIFLKMFYSFHIVGLFSFAYNLANIIMIVGSAFNSINSVTIYKKLANDSDSMRREIVSLNLKVILLFFLLTIGIIMGTYVLIPIAFPKYVNSLPFIVPLCISAFFHNIYLLFVNILFYFSKTKQIMRITISCSLIHVLLSFIFVRYSSLFLAYVMLITNMLTAAFIFYYSSKQYPLPWRKSIKIMKL